MVNGAHQQVTEALELDIKGDVQGAYTKYREALALLLPRLQGPRPSVHKEMLLSHFKIAQNCFDRMQELLRQWPETSGESSGEESDYLQFASSPTEGRHSHILGGHHRSLSQPVSITDKHHRSSSQPTPASPPALQNPSLNLVALRRLHANEMIAKQKERTEKILKAREGALAQNEAYLSDLLTKRQKFYSTVNDRLSEVLRGISAKALDIKQSLAMEQRKKSLKLALLDLERQQDQDYTILAPLLKLLTSKSDPIAVLVRDFISRCRQILNQARLERDPEGSVEKVLDEIRVIEYHIVELLTETFEELANPDLKVSIKLTIQQHFFSTALAPTLITQLRRYCTPQDMNIQDRFLECSWEELFGKLKIKGKLQIPRDRSLDRFPITDAGIYSKAIEELKGLPAASTPLDKMLCLTRCVNAICQAVDEAKREVPAEEGGKEESSVGSEDLLLLTAYVLVRSGISDLFTQMTFISKLVPDELIRGEAGYVLATIQTALDYAIAQLQA